MATKTFSGRVDSKKLEYADAIAKRAGVSKALLFHYFKEGVSFGQYCSTELLDYVCATGTLPRFGKQRTQADPYSTMRLLSRIHA